MSVLMAVFSFPAASECFRRHYHFFLGQGADWLYGVGTTDGGCRWPEGMNSVNIGEDRYIEGPALPNRMLDTIEYFLNQPWRHLILTEYDTLFLNPIPAESVMTVAGYMAGGQTWNSRATRFFHNPWVFARQAAQIFLKEGRQAITNGVCPDRGRGQSSTPECSPDVFFGYVVETSTIPVHIDLWREYSRNDLNLPEHLEEARKAYRDGYDVIHGVKTKEQLEFIQS